MAVVVRRDELRKSFDTREGWRVILTAADGQPLWPQGFDPLNIERLGSHLLHTRFVSIGNDACKATAIDEGGVDVEVLTDGLGPHPLFNGVRRAEVAGLAKPVVTTSGDRVTVATTGLQVDCARATVLESGNIVRVSLLTAPRP
jgi:hypothetical protein